MTNLPKSLRDAMEERSHSKHGPNPFPNTEAEKFWHFETRGYEEGWADAVSHLLSQAPEFDEQAAYEQAHKDSVLVDYGLQSCAVRLACWQHAQTSAIYQAKLAQKDETIADIRAVLKQSGEIQDQMKEEIERLKAELSAAKQHKSHTRCSQCGNQGVYSNGIAILDENQKLAARVEELEGDQEQRLYRAFAKALGIEDAHGWTTGQLIIEALRGEHE